VSLSTAEVKYMVLSLCIQEVLWLKSLLGEMGVVIKLPVSIFEDNQGPNVHNRIQLRAFKMAKGSNALDHLMKFDEQCLTMGAIGDALNNSEQLVILLGSLSDDFDQIVKIIENMGNMDLFQAKEMIRREYDEIQRKEESETALKAFQGTKNKFVKNRGNSKKFIEYKALMENQLNAKIKCIRTDNGKEFVNKRTGSICSKTGIVHQTTVPYTPQQNGLAERMNRTLVERVRAMMDHMVDRS
jgi:hypothetical protein